MRINPHIGFAFVSASLICLFPGRKSALAAELTGKVLAGIDLSPMEGARISLKSGSGVTYSRADGTFTLPFDRIAGIDAPQRAGRPTLRNGRLDFQAAKGGLIRLDLFDMAGKRLASRHGRAGKAGTQSLDVTDLLSGLRGLGWLRVSADGHTEGFRVCKPGMDDRAVAGFPVAAAQPATPGEKTAAAKLAVAQNVLDTLLVEMPGHMTEKSPVTLDALSAGQEFRTLLWKISRFGLDSATVVEWRDFFTKPVQLITISRNSIAFPANSEGSVVVTADGRDVTTWSTLACYPEPPPKSLRLVYTRDGREYRDTVDLAPFWAFHDSFRTRVDSLGPYEFQAYTTWTWPEGLSVLPERELLQLFHAMHFGGHHYNSFPNVFPAPPGINIDGPSYHYGAPDPRAGAWVIGGRTPDPIGYIATLTLARREGHDLRIQLEWRPYQPQPVKLEFLNAWPADGIVRTNQVLRLEGRIPLLPGEEPPSGAATPATVKTYLELSRNRAWDVGDFMFDYTWRTEWDGSPLDWTFPFPQADTISFRLRVRKEWYNSCFGLDESPALTFVPAPD